MVNCNILSIQSMLSQGYSELSPNKTYIGIDFGTSTTVVSIATFNGNKLNIKPLMLKQRLEDGTIHMGEKLPSVIAWYNENLLVGEGASNLKYTLTKGKNIWYSFKMEIGEDLGVKYYNSEIKDIKGISIKNPKDCVRVFFWYLRILIDQYCEENNLSKDIKYAVSIPASFEANQRKELMEALETNGMMLDKQSLIDEPNAAFISYVHESQKTEKPLLISPHYNSKALVFDFGGGTCDISILEIGKSANRLYSKNIAISKYTKLGGDDVDRYLTYHYIMPRFLEYNDLKMEDFRTQEKQYIATQLYKVAEQLKISLCKKISNKVYKLEIPENVKRDNTKEKITVSIKPIETSRGKLRQEQFWLTTEELQTAMKVFLKDSMLPEKIKGEGDEYNNIFIPIKSAIKKANVKIEELDYVLLIGGSAQNPFIQEAIKNYFADSEILVPQDLQTHVSQGAAIHSILLNGMNKCIIQPITSEPIVVITKDATKKVIVPAGAEIPSDKIVIDDLITTHDGQKQIELPLCVGNERKMLNNIIIKREGGFPINSQVKLFIQLSADKLLLAAAECMGVSCMIESQNPFANKELTTEERLVLNAERQSNIDADKNGGVPTKRGLQQLIDAYENAGNDFCAAETYEQMLELYPDPSKYNAVGVLYHNSGNYGKAIEFFERALEYSANNFRALSNMGHSLMCLGRSNYDKAEGYLRKAHEQNNDHYPTLIQLARIEDSKGNKTEAERLRLNAFEILNKDWEQDNLEDWEYGWFASLCYDLGKSELRKRVLEAQKSKKEENTYYNDDNLTKTRSCEIERAK